MPANAINNFLKDIPIELQTICKKKLDNLQFSVPSKYLPEICRLLICSDFASEIILKYSFILSEIFESGDLYTDLTKMDYQKRLQKILANISDEDELLKTLRLFRQREMLRIAWRDINHLSDLKIILTEISDLADAVLETVKNKLFDSLCEQYGMPVNAHNQPQMLLIIAVGKLGARELNFSSDVDLIFCYGESGETNGAVSIDNHHFFTILAQKIIKIISSVTPDGFVYRIDMRLRPFGTQSSLVFSMHALDNYYKQQGREWERYALSRARIISDYPMAIRLQAIINRFVYRRYVDYTAIESLRGVKKVIQRETQDFDRDLKRGAGGIREIEFIVQVFQLIRGGKEPWLQHTSILQLFAILTEKNCLEETILTELEDAYKFLRTAEHRIQQLRDQHTQTLPKDELDKKRIAFGMNFSSWEHFYNALQTHRDNVKKHFANTIAKPEEVTIPTTVCVNDKLDQLMSGGVDDDEALGILQQLQLDDSKQILELLKQFQASFNFRNMDQLTKLRYQQLMPKVLTLLSEIPEPFITFRRFVDLLEKIIRRSVYIVLLNENVKALKQLIYFFKRSLFIAELIIQQPFLLDELVNVQTLYAPYKESQLDDELRQFLLAIPEDDLEAQMECLRTFKHSQILRVAVADLNGTLPLMKVSDHLTFTATIILRHAKAIAWESITARYGYPTENNNRLSADDFAIIAYGKLGGIELGYASDLDLVFLHADVDKNKMTDGLKPISNAEFFVRLAQRIIHMLTTSTTMGSLYAVDTRLRPSGESGLLVSSFSGFAEYQRKQAWTWEHQALVRARVISGSRKLTQDFNELRLAILSQDRSEYKLKEDILTMRARMLAQVKSHKNYSDLKYSRGGIDDIEFIVQYVVLRYSSLYPNLCTYPDNIRILENIAKSGILPHEETKLLILSYKRFRKILHHAKLQNHQTLYEPLEIDELRERVMTIWDKLFTS
jgi:glutamate-ammonia-ligase adenylyltransferase